MLQYSFFSFHFFTATLPFLKTYIPEKTSVTMASSPRIGLKMKQTETSPGFLHLTWQWRKKRTVECISNLSSGDFPASHLSLPRKKLPTIRVQETRCSCSSWDVSSPIPLWIQSPSVSVARNRTPKPPGETKPLSHMIPDMSLKTGNPPLDLRKQNEGMKLYIYTTYSILLTAADPKKTAKSRLTTWA